MVNKASLSVEKIEHIIDDIKQQAIDIDQLNKSKRNNWQTSSNCFSNALFYSRSENLLPYVEETLVNIKRIKKYLTNTNTSPHTSTLLETIEQQISALLTAISSQQTQSKITSQQKAIRSNHFRKKAAQQLLQSSHSLYQKLAETHEFERRLIVMLEDKQQELGNANKRLQEKLTQEVLILHQRLGRCRQAISKIERQIEMSEKR